ncbi:hypothetical protein ASD92_02775 [Massilia sp. Root1485]|nr:hypothetical protein ASD92_02775 [Massilia sp. Root1485]
MKSSGSVAVNTSSPPSSGGVGLAAVPWLSNSTLGQVVVSCPITSRGPTSNSVMRTPGIGISSITPCSSLGRLNAIPSEPR